MDPAIERAAALHAAAVDQHNFGHPAQARRTLLRAERALGRPADDAEAARLDARIRITLALVDSELFGSAAGLVAAERALDVARATGDPALIVPAAGQFGLISMRAGLIAQAIETFGSIAAMLEEGEPLDQFRVLLNLGTARMYLGQLREGRAALVRATHVAREAGTVSGEFKAQHNLAYLDFLLGDLPGALSGMDAAQAADPGVSSGIPLLDRARVLSEAGLVRDADAALASATAIFAADRLAQDLGEAELERARCALVSADVAAARTFAGRARSRFARRGSERWRQSAELVLLQADLAAGRPGRRLMPPARRLRDELAAEGLDVLSRTASLIAAEAALAAGELSEAGEELDRLGRERRRDPITYRLHAHYVRANWEALSGRRAPAAARLRRSLTELAEYQAGFGSLDLSTAAAVHGRRLVTLDLQLAIDSGRVGAIFASAERGRAVTSRLTPVCPPEDPVTAELLAELRQTVESLRGVELDPSRAAPLTRRRSELEAQIAQRAWSRPGAGTVAAPATLGEVRQALNGRMFAMFVVAGEQVGALRITAAGARYQPLGQVAPVRELIRRARADLDVLAQPRLPAPLTTAVRSSFARTAAALDDQLIRPLGVDGELVLITTGLLGQIPWGALPSLRGVPVAVAPSASAWLAADSSPRRRRGGPRLVSLAGPGLARSAEEAAEVARSWGLRTSVPPVRASGAALAKAMASARVVHIAAHGTHQNENPLFSSIRLADGPLFAHELDQTAGTPEHVVLSACELGLAAVRPGDEALGLTSVLLRLGTRSVVAGVARIGDDLAAETMASYHTLLAAGVDSARALARAAEGVEQPLPLVCFGGSWSLTG